MADIHKIADINPTIDNLYRIKLGVINDSDCACYVVFDKEAKQVLEESCVEILDPLLLKGDLSDTPTLLLNLIDKIFLFIVEVQIYDILYFSPSYKVKKMTNNVDLINKFKEAHPIQIDVDYTGGLFPISKTSSIIEGEKVEGTKNLLLEFSNEVAANDESKFDYPRSRKIRRWKEIPQLARRSRLRKKLENLDAHMILCKFNTQPYSMLLRIQILVTQNFLSALRRHDVRSPKQDPILSSQYVVCEGRYNCRFEALDRTLRNLMSVTDQHKTHQPFGGKIVVLGGDFRQILLVIPKGSRHDILASAINSSHLLSFCKILDVGNGNIGSVVGDESEVEISDDLLITTTDDPLSHLVDFSYPNLLQNMSDYRYFQSRAILAPTLKSVKKVNDFVLTIFLGMEKEYLSSDTTCQADENEDWFTPEFLNDIKCSGLLNHKLTLKPGVAVMLLRNIDQTSGLCNGTRLIVNKLGSNVIGATVVTGRNIGDKVYIPRMNLIPSDS
ncbi:hypothetical protein Ahy_A01g002228 [Arachis hypogaea]|uniref:ATP-dependent DNA helicase n=1 Tax=Arachis hypogaea TaxID=3818 RepID=A0A445EQL1_ARAHY|nr:hypothetical protein Ahy_A01g002228 [Arachis hypogaea]